MYPEYAKEATGSVAVGVTPSGSGLVVPMFTHSHLNASLLTMELAKKIEEDVKECPENATQEYSKMRSDYISYSASSIISSVAALESNLNGIIFCKNIERSISVIEQSIHKESKDLNKRYKWFKSKKSALDQLERKSSIIPKYDIIAFLLTGNFIAQNKIKEDAQYLIKIRNALVHYCPEVEAEFMGKSHVLKKHANIKKSRKNRFSYNPLFGKEYCEEEYSFRNCMIHAGSAKWAHKTAKDFIEFYQETIVSKWPIAKSL
jgi:hypothetical protein